MDTLDDLAHASKGACDDSVWHIDETRTLQIEVNGQKLRPRRCEIRHRPHAQIAAVKFEVEVVEFAGLTSEDATAWRFTLRKNGLPLRAEHGWKVAQLNPGGDVKYEVCLEPV